mmetsp:Transcript_38753/g.56966  ORF Transcript_38753/g.56966 Transcript_38753/m.56966 type:complete len:1339 (+) Transcript_38753:658-4674(+)
MVGPEIERVRTEDALRRQIDNLARQLCSEKEQRLTFDTLHSELKNLKALQVADASAEFVSRGSILGGDGGRMRTKAMEKEVEQLRSHNALLLREAEAARCHSDAQINNLMQKLAAVNHKLAAQDKKDKTQSSLRKDILDLKMEYQRALAETLVMKNELIVERETVVKLQRECRREREAGERTREEFQAKVREKELSIGLLGEEVRRMTEMSNKAKHDLLTVRSVLERATEEGALERQHAGELEQELEQSHTELARVREMSAAELKNIQMEHAAERDTLVVRVQELLKDLGQSSRLKTQLEHCQTALNMESAAKKDLRDCLNARVDGLQQSVALLQASAAKSEWTCASVLLEKEALEATLQRCKEDMKEEKERSKSEAGHLRTRTTELTQRVSDTSSKLTKAQDELIALRALPSRLEAASHECCKVRSRAEDERKQLQGRVDSLTEQLAGVREKANTLLTARDAKLVESNNKFDNALQDKQQIDAMLRTSQHDLQHQLTQISDLEKQTIKIECEKKTLQLQVQDVQTALEKALEQILEIGNAKHIASLATDREHIVVKRQNTVEQARDELAEELRVSKQLQTARCRDFEDMQKNMEKQEHEMRYNKGVLTTQLDKLRGAAQEMQAQRECAQQALEQMNHEYEASLSAEAKARQMSAQMNGRVDELETLLKLEMEKTSMAIEVSDQARRDYKSEITDHSETKKALERALDDLDVWEEEHEAQLDIHLKDQHLWQAEREALLDTEVALHAEIHRIQYQNNQDRSEDQTQLQQFSAVTQDALAVRAHNDLLTHRIDELQKSLQQAQQQAGENLDSLESSMTETETGHANSQRALDELHTAMQMLQEELQLRDTAHAARLSSLEALHADQLASQLRENEAQTEVILKGTRSTLAVQHRSSFNTQQEECSKRIEAASASCRSQVNKIQAACRERVEQVEQICLLEGADKEKSLRQVNKDLERAHMEELAMLERKLSQQALRHRAEAELQLQEALSVLAEDNRDHLHNQQERCAEEVEVLKEQLNALALARRDDMADTITLKTKLQDERQQREEDINTGGNTARKQADKLKETHERELQRTIRNMQIEVHEAQQDRDAASAAADKAKNKAAEAAQQIAALYSNVDYFEVQIRTLTSESKEAQFKLHALETQVTTTQDSLRSSVLTAADAVKEAEKLQLELATREAVELHLTSALHEARGDQQKLDLTLQMENMRNELTQAKHTAASMEGRQRTVLADAARLRAQETLSTKTLTQMRDCLHEENCKVAGLEGRVEALEEELLQEKERLRQADEQLRNEKKLSLEKQATRAELKRHIAKQQGNSTAREEKNDTWIAGFFTARNFLGV